ncbi:MAG: DUF1840 domain-containing protein [Proteobacteria bacterium]|nr:DUF1840 domain-containing protein [Pseudomonadota bacterium]
MLVTFTCKEYENITMFGDIATKLIKMMGHSGTTPGAIKGEDVAEALNNLEKALGKKSPETNAEDAEGEPVVSLRNRAIPLLNMLKKAAANKADIMWK